jgi:hypothetical protein
MEAIVDILVRALESLLAHLGNLGDEKEYGGFDLLRRAKSGIGDHKTSGCAILYFIGRFRVEVDRKLKDLLGDGYKKWEEDGNKRSLPRSLVY